MSDDATRQPVPHDSEAAALNDMLHEVDQTLDFPLLMSGPLPINPVACPFCTAGRVLCDDPAGCTCPICGGDGIVPQGIAESVREALQRLEDELVAREEAYREGASDEG